MKLISIFVLLSLLGLVIMAPIEDQETGVVDSNPIRTNGETETFVEKRCGGDENKKKKNKKNKNKQ